MSAHTWIFKIIFLSFLVLMCIQSAGESAPAKKSVVNNNPAPAAQADKNGFQVNAGFDYRNIESTWHFYRSYYGNSTLDANFTLLGLFVEGQYNFIMNNVMISPGLELGYFFNIDCDLDYYGSTASMADTTADAFEIGPYGEVDYRIVSRVSVSARLGLSYFMLYAEAPEPLEEFGFHAIEIYLSPGAKIDITDKIAGMIYFRIHLLDLDTSSDYDAPNGSEWTLDSFLEYGLQIRADYKF